MGEKRLKGNIPLFLRVIVSERKDCGRFFQIFYNDSIFTVRISTHSRGEGELVEGSQKVQASSYKMNKY